jgi:hypothetical protein
MREERGGRSEDQTSDTTHNHTTYGITYDPHVRTKVKNKKLKNYAHVIGCGQLVHWFCAAGNPADNDKGHGAHYWCPPCNLQESDCLSV